VLASKSYIVMEDGERYSPAWLLS